MSDQPHAVTTDRARTQTSTRRQFLAALGLGVVEGSSGGALRRVRPFERDSTPIYTDHELRIDDRGTRITVAVPEATYRQKTTSDHSFGWAYAAAQCEAYLTDVTRQLAQRATDRASTIRAAQSLTAAVTYVSDRASTGQVEFVRYPAETLINDRGDCEDKAILLAGLLCRPPLSCRTALVVVRQHCATLVARADLPETMVPGDPLSVTLEGTEFVYVEAVESVRPGTAAADYADRPRVAAYDGQWTVLNAKALVEWARSAVDRRGLDLLADAVT